MKIYIEKPIIITNNNCEDWDELCEIFQKFDEEDSIFNNFDNKTIYIIEQKISSDEWYVSKFISLIQNIKSLYKVTINTNPDQWKYNWETDRLVVSIYTEENSCY